MRTFDLTPLHRFAVGFDRMQRALDAAARMEGQDFSYPPYNIEQLGENAYRITMAVAGFGEDELDVTQKEETLIVSGKQGKAETDGESTYLHRGIARRAFERRFELADHIKVSGANLANGLLSVDLVREVPEEKQPRKIEIVRGAAEAQTIEHKAA